MTLLDSLEVGSRPRSAGPAAEYKIETEPVLSELVKDQVTVVIPTLNEAGAISEVIEEVKGEGYHNIIVVDGYSKDATGAIASGNEVGLVYQHGIGKAGGVRTALEHVKTPYVLFMDGDGTYNPKDIWRLLNHADRYVHVIGSRDRRNIHLVHRFGNWLISHLFSLLFGVKVNDVCSGMYLLETAEAGRYSLEESGFVAEIELAAQSASMRQLTEVPVDYRARIGRRKLNTWRDGRAILSAAFTLAWRYNPVLMSAGLAGLLTIPALSILSWVLFERVANAVWHLGWALFGAVLLIVGAQALTLAGVSLIITNPRRIPAASGHTL